MTTKKKSKKAVTNYKVAHQEMKGLSEDQILELIQAEHDRGEKARPDLLARLIGRYNRTRGARVSRVVLGLLAYKGKRDVRASLAGDR